MPETTADQRGILYPSRLPTFHREPVSEALADRVVVETPTIEDLAVHIAKEAGRE